MRAIEVNLGQPKTDEQRAFLEVVGLCGKGQRLAASQREDDGYESQALPASRVLRLEFGS